MAGPLAATLSIFLVMLSQLAGIFRLFISSGVWWVRRWDWP